jgi:hypothetical protein
MPLPVRFFLQKFGVFVFQNSARVHSNINVSIIVVLLQMRPVVCF